MKTWTRYCVRVLLPGVLIAVVCMTGDRLPSQEGRPGKADAQKPGDQKAPPPVGGGTRADFQHNPPVATRVLLKWLEKEQKAGNALLQVEFDQASRRRLGRTVDIQLEGRKIVLRNDGKGGDEKADDARYSAVVPIDFKTLETDLKRGLAAEKQQKALPIFKGREKVGVRKPEAPRIDFTKFKPGGLIEIPRFTIFHCPPAPPTPPIDPERSLLIRDLKVVEDPTRTGDPCKGTGTPMGKWSFGHLMTQIANKPVTGIEPSDLVRFWLSSWESPATVNGFPVPARTQIQTQIIGPWEQASGGPGKPLDLAKAPFRLLAIVNRIDLRDNFLYGGGPRSAGEARLVYCAVDPTPGPTCGKALPFTVIFEYGIKKNGCAELKAWAEQWANLSSMPVGTPAYNAALEAITEQFVAAGADPSKPNGSALNQLRTNEVSLTTPWELREFTVSASLGGHLEEVTVKQTPDDTKNGQAVLANYVNANLSAIKADKHVVPALFPGIQRFLGGRAVTDPPRDFWDGPTMPVKAISDRDARHHFSLNACNGCHGGETFPPSSVLSPFTAANSFFTHIKPREAGNQATLSGFLTGNLVPDPADGVPDRGFDDLGRRKAELEKLLTTCCRIFILPEFFFEPLRMVH